MLCLICTQVLPSQTLAWCMQWLSMPPQESSQRAQSYSLVSSETLPSYYQWYFVQLRKAASCQAKTVKQPLKTVWEEAPNAPREATLTEAYSNLELACTQWDSRMLDAVGPGQITQACLRASCRA